MASGASQRQQAEYIASSRPRRRRLLRRPEGRCRPCAGASHARPRCSPAAALAATTAASVRCGQCLVSSLPGNVSSRQCPPYFMAIHQYLSPVALRCRFQGSDARTSVAHGLPASRRVWSC
ncbi:hypothetical protein C2845_PM09G16720 [Panicum miliaceum]|uniref:Uncharacterized protein n=1 Tax=Panicum miliaceum TaxID=4540 RepID=A0A3L6RXC6_PANMI|nr:hypothetical protein C2845_PM09G16720 [Panicum miliaceum]